MALKTILTTLLSVHFSLKSSQIRKTSFLFGECALVSTLTSLSSKSTSVFLTELVKIFFILFFLLSIKSTSWKSYMK